MRRARTERGSIIRFALYVIIICVLGFLAAHFLVQRTVVNGSSMEKTLYDGDNLIIDRISYASSDPGRYDIVVFSYLYGRNTYYVKRIIGLPGETVQITDDGKIMINGRELKDRYSTEAIRNPGTARYPVKLGDDEYFVLGDNRNHSEDSRFPDVGPIRRDQITGKVMFRFYPFDRFGRVK